MNDLWRQWQQALGTPGPFAWNPQGPSAWPGSAAPGFGPFADSAERFANAVRAFLAKSRPTDPSAGTAAESAFAAAEGLSHFLREHFAGSFKSPGSPSAPAPFESTFAEAPALGLGREQVLRAQRALAAWKRLMEAQARLQRMWSDTLREAAAAFTSRLQREPAAPLTAEAIDRLYDLWIDCAEDAYGRTAHGEGFCAALSECVNAGSEWRRETAAGIEEWARLLDLPTRSEINALTLRLRELEVRLAGENKQRGGTRPRAASGGAPQAKTPARTAKAVRPARPARTGKPRSGRAKRRP